MVNIDAVEENLEVFGNVVATAPAEEDTTVEDNLEVFVNVEEDTVEEVLSNVEEDTVYRRGLCQCCSFCFCRRGDWC